MRYIVSNDHRALTAERTRRSHQSNEDRAYSRLNRTRRSGVAEIHQKSVAADRPPDRGVRRTVCRLQRKHHPRHQHCRCQHGGDSPQPGSNCSLGGMRLCRECATASLASLLIFRDSSFRGPCESHQRAPQRLGFLLGAAWWRKPIDPAVCNGGADMRASAVHFLPG
jgi:hypothetical protein